MPHPILPEMIPHIYRDPLNEGKYVVAIVCEGQMFSLANRKEGDLLQIAENTYVALKMYGVRDYESKITQAPTSEFAANLGKPFAIVWTREEWKKEYDKKGE